MYPSGKVALGNKVPGILLWNDLKVVGATSVREVDGWCGPLLVRCDGDGRGMRGRWQGDARSMRGRRDRTCVARSQHNAVRLEAATGGCIWE